MRFLRVLVVFIMMIAASNGARHHLRHVAAADAADDDDNTRHLSRSIIQQRFLKGSQSDDNEADNDSDLFYSKRTKTVVAGCGCEQVCKNANWKWGKCGDGNTCICTNEPPEDMSNGQSADGCGCNKVCQDQGHHSGICGDGAACICKGTSSLPVPPETWQEHWFDHKDLVTRVFYDNDLALYYDSKMSRATVHWASQYVGDVWRYVKRWYGPFGNDPRLYAIFHQANIGGHPGYYTSSSHDYKNVIDVGQGPMLQKAGNTHMPTHEIFHIVEFISFGTQGSPGFGTPPNGIWGDSKMAEIFIYDVEKGLEMHSEAEATKMRFSQGVDNWPKAETYWFRDWLYPWYTKGGGTKALVNFFKLLAQYFPKRSGTQIYSRQMNWGEYIHFSSGAAGSNMKEQAKMAFGWTTEMENQFQQARKDFPQIHY